MPLEDAHHDAQDRVLLGSLVTLILYPPDSAYVVHYLQAAAVVGLLWRACRWQPLYWLGLATAQATYLWLEWFWADNHKYLACYWCLAIAVALAQADRELAWQRLRLTSQWLIGLVMLLAVGWKVLTPEYRDGSFFAHTLLTDERFVDKSAWFLDVDPTALRANRELHNQLASDVTRYAHHRTAVLFTSPAITTTSMVLTWTTVGLEGLLAIVFLWPTQRPRWQMGRDLWLLLFLLGTYLVAPVMGFGGLLGVMGAAQAGGKKRQVAFLLTLALLEVFCLSFRLRA